MSFPQEPPSPQKTAVSQPANGSQAGRRRRIPSLIWIILLAMLGGWAFTQVPLEIGRWHLAKALKLREEGQKEAAYQELEKAMERFPNNPELLLHRGEWQLEDGNETEALADFDQAVEFARDKMKVLEKRGNVLLRAGQFVRAVEDWKQLEQDSRRNGTPPREVALNQLAYAQALAKVELDEALENINRALEIRPNDWTFLDTRGYIYYLKEQYAPALEDLDKSVEAIDALSIKVLQKAPAESDSPPTGERPDRARISERERKELVNAVAVIHYHRALVLAALDRKEDAEKDLAVARELIGREPDERLF